MADAVLRFKMLRAVQLLLKSPLETVITILPMRTIEKTDNMGVTGLVSTFDLDKEFSIKVPANTPTTLKQREGESKRSYNLRQDAYFARQIDARVNGALLRKTIKQYEEAKILVVTEDAHHFLDDDEEVTESDVAVAKRAEADRFVKSHTPTLAKAA